MARYRIDESDAGMLALRSPPAWTFLTGLKSSLSRPGSGTRTEAGNDNYAREKVTREENTTLVEWI